MFFPFLTIWRLHPKKKLYLGQDLNGWEVEMNLLPTFLSLKLSLFHRKVLIEIYWIWVLLNNNKSSRETSFTLSHTWLNMMITFINNPYTLNHFIASQKCHDPWFKESVTCLWASKRENVQNLWPTAIVHLCGKLNYIHTRIA